MRRFLPDTLVGRTVLVLLLGLALSQLAGVILFELNRSELANRLSSRHFVERIADNVSLLDSTSENERGRVVRALEAPGLRIGWGQQALLLEDDDHGEGGFILEELHQRLGQREVHAAILMPSPLPPPSEEAAQGPGMHRGRPLPLVQVAVRLNDESWLNFSAPLAFPESLWHPRFFGPLAVGLLVVTVLSVTAVRRAARPLAVLSAAAQRLGRDVGAPPVPETGPREVRAAAHAFNEMQTRLRRFIDDRTQMVAAISHDLRTPITRLKLRAEFVEDEEQRAKILMDLDEMEAMIAATLAFARDDAAREERKPVDLAALLAELAGEFGATYQGPESLMISAGPTAIKRGFANLLDNAFKYAGGAVVSLEGSQGQVTALIEDRGPGVPPAELEQVFQPFYRVEASRNRETGGTGLGLSVARSAARAHGGDVRLENRVEGGLRAIVILPTGV